MSERVTSEGARSAAARVQERLRASANPRRRAHTEGYFPTSMEILGVAVPDIRRAVRPEARRLARAPGPDVLDLAFALVAGGTHEGRQAAYELLGRRRDVLASLTVREVEALGRGNDNWASVDAFGTLVAGPAWRTGRVTDRTVARWTRSRDRWWRRTALVSTVALNLSSRGGTGEVARTLRVCDALAADTDDMVAKALSWALRSVAGHDPRAVAAFLDRHESVLARRVTREVRNKLATGKKNPRRDDAPAGRENRTQGR